VVPKVIDLLREMARMGREPVRDAELELARSCLIGSFPLRLDTSAKVAGFISSVEAEGWASLRSSTGGTSRVTAVTSSG
jgi:predicted Zn-dependent peptidase